MPFGEKYGRPCLLLSNPHFYRVLKDFILDLTQQTVSCGVFVEGLYALMRIVCTAQPSFIGAFGLSKTDLPTLVAFHPKKLRGAQLKGAYSSQSIDALLDGLFAGSIHSEAFQALPALIEGGEDEVAAKEPVEEEFDLADVLGEDVGSSGSKEDLLKQADKELEVLMTAHSSPA